MSKSMKVLLMLLIAALLSGCTDDNEANADNENEGEETGELDEGMENETREPAVITVQIAAVRPLPTDTHAFDTERIEVNQGDFVTITLTNDDSLPIVSHDWYLEVLDIGTSTIAPGETTSVTFQADLGPGEYAFYCTIGTHREDGMEGVLVVV